MLRHLHDFNQYLSSLNKNINQYRGTTFDIPFYEIFHRTLLIELILEKQPIAVGGMQGVGKTTLLRSLIKMPDNLLPHDSNFGEQIPVFITLAKGGEIETRLFEIKGGKLDFNIVDRQSFERATRHLINEEQKNKIVCGEIIIPSRLELTKLYENEISSFLLLPGFEENSNILDKIVKQCINASPACIFLFTDKELADNANFSKLEELEKDYVKTKPIYILSKADMSSDQNLALKKEVKKRLRIPKHESGRILISGSTPTLQEQLKINLPNTILEFNEGSEEIRYALQRDIKELMTKTREDIISKVENIDIKTKYSDKNFQKQENIEGIIAACQDEINILQKKYALATEESLAKSFEKIRKAVNEKFLNRNILVRAWDSLKTKPKVKEEILDKILDEMKSPQQNESILNEEQYLTINRLCRSRSEFVLRHAKRKNNLVRSENDEIGTTLVLPHTSPGKEAKKDGEILVSLLQVIYSDNSKFEDSVSDHPEKIEWILKLIPYIALEYVKLGSILVKAYDTERNYFALKDMNWKDLEGKSRKQERGQESIPMIRNYRNDSEQSILLASRILGLKLNNDVSSNETSTLIGGLTDPNFAMVVGGLVLTSRILKETYDTLYRSQDSYNTNQINNILTTAKQAVFHQYMSSFESIMDDVRNLLKERLRVKFGLTRSLGLEFNYNRDIERIEKKITEILNII